MRRSLQHSVVWVCTAILWISANSALAEDTARPEIETRIYDISDLVAASDEQVSTNRSFQMHPVTERLIDQISKGVGQKDEWALNGGDTSSIDELNNTLVVKTSPENHQAIQDIITQHRMILKPEVVFPDPPDLTMLGERRLYQVRDLYVPSTWYIHPVHMDDREAQRGPPTQAEQLEKVCNLITETIGDFNEWNINGGDVSRIDEVSGGLLITTSPRKHYEIHRLLMQYRMWHHPPTRFEVVYLLVPVGELVRAGIDPELERIDGQGGREVGFAFLPASEANALLRKVENMTDAVTVTPNLLHLSDGQKNFTELTSQSQYIADYQRYSQFEVEYDAGVTDTIMPDIRYIQEGVIFSAYVSISQDRGYVKAILRPTLVNVVSPIPEEPWDEAPEGQSLLIGKPEISVLDVELTVSMPDETTLLIDLGHVSGPLEEVDLADTADESVERRVLVLVKARMNFVPVSKPSGGR